LFLESEVTAAREAQLRLLPLEPPRMDGLSISASCQAAEEVGGDFYDFFRLAPHRLGVLVSDGGGRGLEAALTIALAKGYLMQKAHSGRTPLETLRALRAALGSAMETDESSGFCYAVLDLQAGTFDYARHGPSPCVLVENALPEALEDGAIFVGSGQLHDRTRIIIYTDGVGRRLRRPGKGATDRWIQQVLAWHRNASAAELSEAILREVFSKADRGGARLEDDVTLVILAMEKAGERSMGHVA
jgi:sigma-B regulation protein RsbU (phosphoserine phosphatase)